MTGGIAEDEYVAKTIFFLKAIREVILLTIVDGFFPLIYFVTISCFRDNHYIRNFPFDKFSDDRFELWRVV